MKFLVPVPFEVGDDIWHTTGADRFTPLGPSYRFGPYEAGAPLPVELVELNEVRPPVRDAGIVGLHPDRLASILRAMCTGQQLPAVLGQRNSVEPYELVAGYHRFYASVALGYTHLPVAVRPYFTF